MNLNCKTLFSNKLALWSVLGLAGLVLGVLGPSSAWAADDDNDQDTGQAWLGVALQELSPQLREALDVDASVKGLVIVEVQPESPAAKAGLQEKDVIVSLGGKNVDSIEEATDLVQDMKPGSRLSVSVLREGRRRQFTARLAEREDREESRELDRPLGAMKVPEAPMPPDAPLPPGEPSMPGELPGDMSGRGYLGVNTMALGQQLAEYFGLSENQGVLVTEVSKDSPAEAAGLKAGDIILSVGDSKIDSPVDLMRLIRAHDPEDQVDVVVQRKGESHTLKAKLGEAKEMGFLAPRARHMMNQMQDMMMHHDMQGHMHEHQGPSSREVIVMRHRSGAQI